MGSDTKWSDREWQSGDMLADHYRIESCVKHSSTCSLFRAHDVFRRTSHLLLCPTVATRAKTGGVGWFRKYGNMVLAIPPHQNLVLFDRMDHDHAVPFLVGEDVQGEGWDELIERDETTELNRMLVIALGVARGLRWMHEQGVVHYNIKPANVLVCEAGIARIWKCGEEHTKTRAYASPEQLAGLRPLAPTTDIWSWAVSVLHAFVGEVVWPSGASAPAALQEYETRGPRRPDLPLMPGGLAELLSNCLESYPEERPGSIAEVVQHLESLLDAVSEAPPLAVSGSGGAEAVEAESELEAPTSNDVSTAFEFLDDDDDEDMAPDKGGGTDESDPAAPPPGQRRFYGNQSPGGRRRPK
jgi:serine/threonine protein kinase